jgi:hypothetical protein
MAQDAKLEMVVDSQHELLPGSPAAVPSVQAYADIAIS